MAVLVGVLAPQFLKYVEQSRVQKDESAMGEVNNAVKIACSVEEVYDSLSGGEVVAYSGGSLTGGTSELLSELAKTIPTPAAFTSKKYKSSTSNTTITINASDSTVQVETVCGTFSVQ